MTPAGIEPATFRFVAQHLNHCATAVPHIAHKLRDFQGEKIIRHEMSVFFCLYSFSQRL